MEAWLNNPIAQAFGYLIAALVIASTVAGNWFKERAHDEATRKATAAFTPELMRRLGSSGTRMDALTVDLANDLYKAIELQTDAVKALTATLVSTAGELRLCREIVESARREWREHQIREQAFRDGQARGRGPHE